MIFLRGMRHRFVLVGDADEIKGYSQSEDRNVALERIRALKMSSYEMNETTTIYELKEVV